MIQVHLVWFENHSNILQHCEHNEISEFSLFYLFLRENSNIYVLRLNFLGDFKFAFNFQAADFKKRRS